MRRKREYPDGNIPPREIRKAFSRDQLAEVGAVVLAWNHLEVALDSVLESAWWLPDLYTHEVIGRIHGIDGKIALARIASTDVFLSFDPSDADAIKVALDGAAECKRLRDSVAHARTTIVGKKDVVLTTGGRGQSFDLLFSAEILARVADQIDLVTSELLVLSVLYAFQLAITDDESGGADPEIQSLQQDAQEHMARLRQLQKRRLSLPPLPPFPEEPRDQLSSGWTPKGQA